MTEKIKNVLDKGGIGGALLTDLSKAFDCIQHNILIAKLRAYDINIKSLKLLNNYLYNRKQRTKINSTFSEWVNITFFYFRVLSWVPYFSTYISMTYFFLKKKQT